MQPVGHCELCCSNGVREVDVEEDIMAWMPVDCVLALRGARGMPEASKMRQSVKDSKKGLLYECDIAKYFTA